MKRALEKVVLVVGAVVVVLGFVANAFVGRKSIQ